MRNFSLGRWLIVFGAFGALNACSGNGGGTPDGSDSAQQGDTIAPTDTSIDAPRADGADVTNPQDRVNPTDTLATDVPSDQTTITDGATTDTTPGTDSSTSDGGSGTDASVAPGNPCAAVVNLNTAGTITATSVTYTGDNTALPRLSTVPGDVSCTTNVGHAIAFSYTVRTGGHIVATTDSATTNFDTVLWGLDHCAATGTTSLGCNDDDNTASPASTFTTPSTVAAGTTIFIVLGGFMTVGQTGATGPFQLTVTEVPEVAVGATCDPNSVTNSCPPTAHCLGTTPTCVMDIAVGGACVLRNPTADCVRGAECVAGTSTTCMTIGILNGPCNRGLPQCNTGLGCNTNDTCVATVALAAACDTNLVTNVCADGASCSTAGMCVIEGPNGANCRQTEPQCDTALACNFNNTCVPSVAPGDACDPNGDTNFCTLGANCLGSVCRLDQTAGGFCAGTSGQDCNPGLICSDNGVCIAMVAAGGSCDPTGGTTVCATGTLCTGTPPTCANVGYTESALTAPTLINACTTGTRVDFGANRDDGHPTAATTIPFTFTYFRAPFTQIWPDTNGYAVFGNNEPQDTNGGLGVIPTTDEAGMIAPWEDDLIVGDTPGSDVCINTTGATPNRKFVIEWFNVSRFDHSPAVALTFELVLNETTNTIDFIYGTLAPTTGADAPFADGSNAAIGMQDPTATVTALHTGTVTSNSGIRFTPN